MKSEKEIISNWGGNLDRPIVSICCITYNHSQYIEQAVNNFLSQNTTFPFEILIHDDASTDGTREILHSYQKLYPRLIKLMLQKDNQYSSGIRLMYPTFLFPKAKGKYIALCEGDDFWTDKYKLEKQVTALNHSKLDICFHYAELYNNQVPIGICCKRNYKECIIGLEKIIIGGGHFMPTASILFRSSKLSKIFLFAKENSKIPYGDYFWQVLLSSKKGAYYLNESMCVYRMFADNSWSSKMKQDSKFSFSNDIEFLNGVDSLFSFLPVGAHPVLDKFKRMKIYSFILDCKYTTKKKRYLYELFRKDLKIIDKILIKLLSYICLSWFKKNLKKIFKR